MENLPKNWVNISFTDLLGINGGTQPPKSQFIYEPKEGYIRLLQIRDFGKKPVPTYVPNTGKLRTCLSEDVLIARYGASIGRIVTGQEGAYNVALAKVNIPEDINKNFIKWLLKSHLFQNVITSFQRTAQSGFNKDDLSGIIIPLPPLAEQQRIVAKLDTLFGHLDALKQRLELIPSLLKQFRQSVLTQAVTGKLTGAWREGKDLGDWEEKQLCDLRKKECEYGNIELEKSGRRKQKIKPFTWNGKNKIGWAQVNFESATIFIIDCLHNTPKFEREGKFIIDTTCISPFKIHWDKTRKINEEYYQKWVTRLLPSEGDILFSREGTIGIGVKVPSKKEICIGQRMMLFRFGSYIISDFAEIYVNSMVFKDEFRPHIKGVAAQHLNIGDIRQLNFPIPTIKEQTEIVKRVEALFTRAETIEAAYDKLKQQIDNLPQAILAKAFKGELVEQLPTDGDAKDLLKEIAALHASLEKEKKSKKKKKVNA